LRHELLPERRPAGLQKTAAGLSVHGLVPIRIVQFQDARLGEDMGRAEAEREMGIALHLHRPAVVTGDQQTGRHAGQIEGRGEPFGQARLVSLGTFGERNDLLLRPATAGQPRHGEGGRHELQEPAAAQTAGGRCVRICVLGQTICRTGKFRLQVPPELFAVGQLLQAAPVALFSFAGSGRVGHRNLSCTG